MPDNSYDNGNGLYYSFSKFPIRPTLTLISENKTRMLLKLVKRDYYNNLTK